MVNPVKSGMNLSWKVEDLRNGDGERRSCLSVPCTLPSPATASVALSGDLSVSRSFTDFKPATPHVFPSLPLPLSSSPSLPPSLPPAYLPPSGPLCPFLSPLVPLSLRPSLSRTSANHLVDRSIWPHTTARLRNRVGPRFLMHWRQGWQTQVACGREERPRSGRSCGAGSGVEVLCVGGDAESL